MGFPLGTLTYLSHFVYLVLSKGAAKTPDRLSLWLGS